MDRFGPVTTTVLGHAKTCLIIAIGWVSDQQTLSDGGLIGITLTVVGMVAYVCPLADKEKLPAC